MRTVAVTTLLVLLGGCDWTRFDEIAERAPVQTLGPAGDIRSASFGDGLVGLLRQADAAGKSAPGSLVVGLGNGDASLGTFELTEAGALTRSGSDAEEMKKLGSPKRLHALAPAPPGSQGQPRMYLAADEVIRIVEATSYYASDPIRYTPDWGSWEQEPKTLGLSLAVSGELLLAGSSHALVLLRMAPGGVSVTTGRVLSGAAWMAGACRAVAAGSLGEGTPLRVAGGHPDEGRVLLLLDASACLASAADCRTLEIPRPDGAEGFGAAVLIADFDPSNPGNELLVGAPGAGKVFVFSLPATLAPDTKVPSPAVLVAPAGAGRFGAALALGPLVASKDGPRTVLVVGAPTTAVDGTADAGALYVYDRGAPAPKQSALASPVTGGLLGKGLGLVPFLRSGEAAPRQVLAAAGAQAVYLFFSHLVDGHLDVR